MGDDDEKLMYVDAVLYYKKGETDGFIIFETDGAIILGGNNKYLFRIRHDRDTGEIIGHERSKPPLGYDEHGNGLNNACYTPLTYLIPAWRRNLRRVEDYDQHLRLIRKANIGDYVNSLWNSVKDIRLYQGGIEEVARQTGRKLGLVDTGKPRTFLHMDSEYIETQGESVRIGTELLLRLEAKKLGADAVVHYLPGSSMGTPVKYVD